MVDMGSPPKSGRVRRPAGLPFQPIVGAVSETIGSAAIFIVASIVRNRMTRLDRVRPTQTDRDATKRLGLVDAATWVMIRLVVQRSGGFGLLTAHSGKRGIEIHP